MEDFLIEYAIMYWIPTNRLWIAIYNDDFDSHLNGYKISWVSFEDYHEFWEK
jgi:hypothetical protein